MSNSLEVKIDLIPRRREGYHQGVPLAFMLRRGHVTWALNGWMLEEPCLLDDEYPSPYLSNERTQVVKGIIIGDSTTLNYTVIDY